MEEGLAVRVRFKIDGFYVEDGFVGQYEAVPERMGYNEPRG